MSQKSQNSKAIMQQNIHSSNTDATYWCDVSRVDVLKNKYKRKQIEHSIGLNHLNKRKRMTSIRATQTGVKKKFKLL